jgi:hypothetical protein
LVKALVSKWMSQGFKGKVKPGHKTYGGVDVYIAPLFLISALDEGEWSTSRPGCFIPGIIEPPVPIGKEAGWASEPVRTLWIKEKSLVAAGNRTLAVKPIDLRYTD